MTNQGRIVSLISVTSGFAMQRDKQQQGEEERALGLASFTLTAREGCDDAKVLLASWWLVELH